MDADNVAALEILKIYRALLEPEAVGEGDGLIFLVVGGHILVDLQLIGVILFALLLGGGNEGSEGLAVVKIAHGASRRIHHMIGQARYLAEQHAQSARYLARIIAADNAEPLPVVFDLAP